MNTIGERLRAERERLKLSQDDFAELAGLTRNTQIKYEKGERSPDAAYLAALAERGLDVLYVVCGIRKTHTTASPEQSRLLDAYAATAGQGRRAALLVMEALAAHEPARQSAADDPDLWRKVARGIPTAPGVDPASRLTAQQWLEIAEKAYRIELEAQAEPARAIQGR